MDASWQERFSGIDRLYGRGTLERLAASHVAVIGLGGVGSWAVEALARSGVGALTLVDADELCVSNPNRQLPALARPYGRGKAEAMAEIGSASRREKDGQDVWRTGVAVSLKKKKQ